MDELVQWLRVQLDADDRLARQACGDDGWVVGERALCGCCVDIRSGKGALVCTLDDRDAPHIAEWDPARVLREADAKRQVLGRYDKAGQAVEELSARRNLLHARGEDVLMVELGLESAIHGRDALAGVLRLLALPYADRPGYREEWRP